VALLALAAPERLRSGVRVAVTRGPNLLSVVSYWEVVLKSMKGTLKVGDPRAWWSDALEQLAATPLLLRPEHVSEVLQLPPVHQDPFDRMLAAQAAAEQLTLVTNDGEMAKYASDRLKVLR
jgi:PIN domain nuclease of toxin-antitoxin system